MTTTVRAWSVCALTMLLAWSAAPADAAATDPLYGARICVAADAPKDLRKTAAELATWLNKGTGAAFTVAAPPAEAGIFLLTADSPLAPPAAAELTPLVSREAFLLLSDGPRLYIVSKTPLGVRNGAYFYLEQLGFRWFLPGEHWTIVPTLKSVALDVHRVSAPALRMRSAFGTGGFGGNTGGDPHRSKQARWEQWMQRIRLDGEAEISGHAGDDFNLTYKKELTEHPEYLAEVNGKRQPWGQETKPCYSNPGLLALWVKNRMERLREAVAAAPDSPHSFAVSVEPSDGGGYCQCAECRKIGSTSDCVIYAANAVAREVAKEFPGRQVSLLAYASHADVPHIAVEPNVYVVVIPYGFNRTGLSPEELLSAWSLKKPSNLGLYDYWAIPDWSHDEPAVNFEQMAAKVRLWRADHVDGVSLESDYSAGATGLVWYLASRLFWDPQTDIHAVLDDFYGKAFGAARVPMERMIGRWGRGFDLTEGELGLSYRDIQEARALAKDPSIAARVNDYALYLHYLRLWYEYQLIAPKSETLVPKLRGMLTYLWRIYPTDMTHSFRLTQLLTRGRALTRNEADEVRAEWGGQNLEDLSAPAWKNVTPVAATEVGALVADGAQNYPVIPDVEPRSFSSTLVALAPTRFTLDAQVVETQSNGNVTDYEFYVPEGVSLLKIGINRVDGHGPKDRVSVTSRQGAPIFRKEIASSGEWEGLDIPIPGPGYYNMNVLDQKQRFQLRVPARLPFVIKGGFMSAVQSPRMYFFVPLGTKRVAFICALSDTPVEILSPTGAKLPTIGNRLLYVDVPPGQDGKAWSMQNVKTWEPLVHLVNVPNVWSFSPDALMVPEDVALKPSGR